MKNIGTVVAVTLTAAIVLAIGVFSFLPAAESSAGADPTAEAPVSAQLAPSMDSGAIQAAFAAREMLIQSQIMALDLELASREADYNARADELAVTISAGDEQLALVQQREAELGQQLDELLAAQSSRATVYKTQRGQAYSQYQVSLQQLKAQRDEAAVKLAEAQARLGQ